MAKIPAAVGINPPGTHVVNVQVDHSSRFYARCSICGRVGGAQDYRGDAEAIADDHRDRQGFSDGRAR